MSQYITIQSQTIWDLSIRLYGNSSNAVKIVSENPGLDYIGKLIPPGTVIEYTEPVGNTITTFLSNRQTDPVTGTGNPLQGSGFSQGFTINGHN
jgi:phage tail protein X